MKSTDKNVIIEDLGLIAYKDAWEYQEKIFKSLIAKKSSGVALTNNDSLSANNYLLFCEHPHVYTIGKSGRENNLLINDDFLKKIGATYYKSNRGGDITYHGQGQIVGYPILDLDNFGLKVKSYINLLEDIIIKTIASFGIVGQRLDGATGVWLDVDNNKKVRKICAMGVKVSRWVSMHGFALNVNTDLKYFEYINPCGYSDKKVTSLSKELGKQIDLNEVKKILVKQFIAHLGVNVKADNMQEV